MTMIRDESAHTINGVRGRMMPCIVWPNGTLANQEWRATREIIDDGEKYRMTVRLRFDDSCKNGHPSFAITADIRTLRGRDVAGGCLHDEIAKHFPKLRDFIQWHLCASDGPMRYLANTVYHASDRDHNGCLAGEPYAWSQAVRFGENPIRHKLKDSFAEFLKADRSGFDFEVLCVPHRDQSAPGKHQFAPKYTFGGYGKEWHDCPFDSEETAFEFLAALQRCKPEFVQIPTLFGEGKNRNFDAARSTAIWPEATDAQLSLPKDELQELLKARLPDLLARFRETMIGAGFIYDPDLFA